MVMIVLSAYCAAVFAFGYWNFNERLRELQEIFDDRYPGGVGRPDFPSYFDTREFGQIVLIGSYVFLAWLALILCYSLLGPESVRRLTRVDSYFDRTVAANDMVFRRLARFSQLCPIHLCMH